MLVTFGMYWESVGFDHVKTNIFIYVQCMLHLFF